MKVRENLQDPVFKMLWCYFDRLLLRLIYLRPSPLLPICWTKLHIAWRFWERHGVWTPVWWWHHHSSSSCIQHAFHLPVSFSSATRNRTTWPRIDSPSDKININPSVTSSWFINVLNQKVFTFVLTGAIIVGDLCRFWERKSDEFFITKTEGDSVSSLNSKSFYLYFLVYLIPILPFNGPNELITWNIKLSVQTNLNHTFQLTALTTTTKYIRQHQVKQYASNVFSGYRCRCKTYPGWHGRDRHSLVTLDGRSDVQEESKVITPYVVSVHVNVAVWYPVWWNEIRPSLIGHRIEFHMI